jgi:hypothetical protein
MGQYYKIQVAEMATPECMYDEAVTIDGCYIGSPETAKYLCDERGIKPELASPTHRVCSIGFCEKDQKWYGWSHRAIFGFGIGSKVSKGDCAYVADTPEGLIDSRVEFFSDINLESEALHRAECQILPDRSGIRILHAPLKIPVVNSIDEIESAMAGDLKLEVIDLHKDAVSVQKCGRGEWEAATLDDAKQMAIDFAESVS